MWANLGGPTFVGKIRDRFGWYQFDTTSLALVIAPIPFPLPDSFANSASRTCCTLNLSSWLHVSLPAAPEALARRCSMPQVSGAQKFLVGIFEDRELSLLAYHSFSGAVEVRTPRRYAPLYPSWVARHHLRQYRLVWCRLSSRMKGIMRKIGNPFLANTAAYILQYFIAVLSVRTIASGWISSCCYSSRPSDPFPCSPSRDGGGTQEIRPGGAAIVPFVLTSITYSCLPFFRFKARISDAFFVYLVAFAYLAPRPRWLRAVRRRHARASPALRSSSHRGGTDRHLTAEGRGNLAEAQS